VGTLLTKIWPEEKRLKGGSLKNDQDFDDQGLELQQVATAR